MLDKDKQAAFEECIELLREPRKQLEAANRLIGLCMAARTERRPTARVAISSMMGELLEKPLMECLLQVTPLVRRKLAFVLGEMGGSWQFEPEPAAVHALAQLAREDSDADVRAAAVDALGKLGGPGAVNTLKEVTEKDSVSAIRVRALFSWEQLAPPPEHEIQGVISIDEFLKKTARLEDRDTSTVARELRRKRGLGP